MAITIKDIAEELNLSTPTVSRILSGVENHRVAEATRQRVTEAAQRMNYRPNAVARSLRSGRTGSIGFYTDHVYKTPNSFYATIIHGLQTACSARDLDLMLYGSFQGRSSREIYNGLRDRRVDGLILHADSSDSLVERLSDSPFPVVAIADPLQKLPSVACDDEAGMRNLAAHLARLGYRRFVFVRPNKPFTSVERRWNALKGAVARNGGEIQAVFIELEDASSLLDELDAIARQSPDRLAVCCWNDVSANSLLRAACDRCWQIPAKMAITGFDGFGIQQLSAQRLTTLICPWDEVVRAAVELLTEKIEGQAPAMETRLLPTLFAGDTA